MRFRILLLVPVFLLLSSWGFYSHRTINNTAIYALPEPLIHFYKSNADYLTEHSVDADKRRHMVPEEAPRHYLDVDYYEQALPLDTIPHYWNQAIQCFSEDTITAYGIGPWHLEKQVYFLQKAFSEKDIPRILKLSADVGHYTGDLHVPLHTTLNYNGQLTGQKGIHAFWESRLPELFAEEYDYFVGKAEYLPNINTAIWTAFEASVAARDSVLGFEKQLDSTFKGEKYAFEDRGKGLVKTYSKAYSKAYHEMLSGQVERRMQAAIKLLADLWYTAWVNAGSPDLGVEPNSIGMAADSISSKALDKEEYQQR